MTNDEKPQFDLVGGDHLQIKISSCSSVLKKLNVKYVLFNGKIEENIDISCLKELYKTSTKTIFLIK